MVRRVVLCLSPLPPDMSVCQLWAMSLFVALGNKAINHVRCLQQTCCCPRCAMSRKMSVSCLSHDAAADAPYWSVMGDIPAFC